MLAELRPGQFEEWRAYADVEPFDEDRADYRAASIVQAIHNHRRRRGQPLVKLVDCLLRFDGREASPAPGADAGTMSSLAQFIDLAREMRGRRRAKAKAVKRRAQRRKAKALAPASPKASVLRRSGLQPRKVGR